MKITGNSLTIKFEIEKPDEIPMLKRLGTKLGPYCGSFADETRTIQGIEISTEALFRIVEESAGNPKA